MCAIFADSAPSNVCEFPIIGDRGISADTWVVLKETSMEVRKIASTSLRFEIFTFYYAVLPPHKYSPPPGED